MNDLYDDYEEDNEDDYLFSSDSPSRMYRDYWDESEELNGEKRTDRFDEESEPQQFTAEEDLMEWETCSYGESGTAYVLLPPLSVEKPTAIVHFVGGTFFGSSPNVWYNYFLKEIVKHTNVAVIATSIPVTVGVSLSGEKSPLNHVALAKKLGKQFQMAFRDVLVDEYGAKNVVNLPVCGLGHSLGSRLLVVLATLGATTAMRRKNPTPAPYSSFVLVSFTNFGAAAGIPGISQLNKASRRLQKEADLKRKRSPRRQQTKRKRSRDSYMDENDDFWYEDEDDDEWGEIFADIGDALKVQATRIQTALTPASESLEFYPSPDQLLKAVTIDQRYNISETLLVQFDDDEVDQSSKLATSIQNSASDSNVYFGRIRGTHLTPVVPGKPDRQRGSDWLGKLNSRLSKSLAKLLDGRAKYNKESIRELRQVVSSYIIEVAAKERSSIET